MIDVCHCVYKKKAFDQNTMAPLNSHISKEKMSENFARSLHTLPIELVYRILDELDDCSVMLQYLHKTQYNY